MICNFFTGIFHYFKRNTIVCIVAVYAIAMVIPPIPFSVPAYYLMLAALFVYMLSRNGIRINALAMAFIVAAAVSILLNNPPAVFHSWQRLGLLVMVMGSVFPLFSSFHGNRFQSKLLMITLWLFVAVGVVSFGCYLLGINYMRMWRLDDASINSAGTFGGITQHSMILGPLSAFGSIYLFCKLLYSAYRKPLSYVLWASFALCVISTLLSASRASLLCVVLGILISLLSRYKNSIGTVVRRVALIVAALIVCYPIYSKFTMGVMSKQEANERSGSMFYSRDEKWTNRTKEFEQSPFVGIGFAAISLNTSEGQADATRISGVVEPGSSWLAALSMTGLLGAIPLFSLIIGTLFKLWKRVRLYASFQHTVLLALLSANVFHQFAEGYAFAGGSYLCFFFWLLLGVSVIYSTGTNNEIRKLDL